MECERRRLDLEFDITNVSNSIYQIAEESEEIPIQYAPSRTVGGSLNRARRTSAPARYDYFKGSSCRLSRSDRAALKRACENLGRLYGTSPVSPHSPSAEALGQGSQRPSGADFRAFVHREQQTKVLAHILKRCSTQDRDSYGVGRSPRYGSLIAAG